MRHFNKDSFDYKFEKKIEAGLVLTGSDTKSLRNQTCSLGGTKVILIKGRPFLVNISIPHYKFSNIFDNSEERALLLNKKQILEMITYDKQKYMFVPIAIYLKKNKFKLEFGIGRKMRKYEKREKIKEKELKRQGIK